LPGGQENFSAQTGPFLFGPEFEDDEVETKHFLRTTEQQAVGLLFRFDGRALNHVLTQVNSGGVIY